MIYCIMTRGEISLDSREISFVNFSENVTIVKERKDNRLEERIEGEFVFFDKAFDLITRDLSTDALENFLSLFIDNKEYKLKFAWVDGEINFEDKIFTVTPKPINADDKVQGVLTKEMNVLALKPPSFMVNLTRERVIQVTMRVGNNFSGHALIWYNGGFRDIEIEKGGSSSIMVNTCHFSDTKYQNMNYKVNYAAFTSSEYVIFDGHNLRNPTGFMLRFTESNITVGGVQKRQIKCSYIYPNGTIGMTRTKEYYLYQNVMQWWDAPEDFYATPVMTLNASLYVRGLYSWAAGGYAKSENDVDKDTNFTQVYPISLGAVFSNTSIFRLSARIGTTPTQWGVNSDGRYYYPPNDTEKWSPMCQDLWANNYSFWFLVTTNLDTLSETSEVTKKVHGYLIDELINAICKDNGIELNINKDYFLDSSMKMVVLPISNVVNYNYANPQRVLNTSLSKLLDVYCKINNAEWFVEGDELKIVSRAVIYKKNNADHDLNNLKWLGNLQNIIYGKVEPNELPYLSKTIRFQSDNVTPVFKSATLNNIDNLKSTENETVEIGCDVDMYSAVVRPGEWPVNTESFFVGMFSATGQEFKVNATKIGLRNSIKNLYLSPEYLAINVYGKYLGCNKASIEGIVSQWDIRTLISAYAWTTEIQVPRGDFDVDETLNTMRGRCKIVKTSKNISNDVQTITITR